jgi:hypothetical protein
MRPSRSLITIRQHRPDGDQEGARSPLYGEIHLQLVGMSHGAFFQTRRAGLVARLCIGGHLDGGSWRTSPYHCNYDIVFQIAQRNLASMMTAIWTMLNCVCGCTPKSK